MFLIGISLFVIFRKDFFTPPSHKKYDEFGIYLPVKYQVHGIDVSHHQGQINWELVSKMQVDSVNVDFVFIKATEGRNHKDRKFKRNWKHSKKQKLIRGAYHYFKPHVDGVVQAKNFCNSVTLSKGDLPPVIDVEEIGNLSSKELVKRVKAMVKYLENKYGVEPIIYTFHDFYKLHFKGEFDNYPLWIAHYYVRKPKNQLWNFWQLSDRATISGIDTPVDFNVFNRDKQAFKRLLIQ